MEGGAQATVMTLATYLETLGTVITKVFEWVVKALGVITSNPIPVSYTHLTLPTIA